MPPCGAALATAGTGWALRARPPLGMQAWARTNHRGEPVTLLAGPAVAIGATLAAALTPSVPTRVRLATLVAGSASGALGAYDDLAGTGRDRGFRGHLRALRRGEVSTGALKVLGIGAAGLLAGGLLREGALERILAGGVVAGTANLVNLLDLRPGRALKAVVALSATEIAAGFVRGGGAGPAARSDQSLLLLGASPPLRWERPAPRCPTTSVSAPCWATPAPTRSARWSASPRRAAARVAASPCGSPCW